MPASFTSTAMTRDNLLLDGEVITKPVTLLAGQNLLRGAVLGKVSGGGATAAAKAGGNTAQSGTLVMDGTNPVLANGQVGVYKVRCIATTADKGTFEVKDPRGNSLGQVVAALTTGTVFADQVQFTLTSITGHDFAVGDGFDVTVAAGGGGAKLSLLAAVDGSQVPDCILAEDTDATSADKATIAYMNATVNQNALIFGTGQTIANCLETLRGKDIQLVDVKTTY